MVIVYILAAIGGLCVLGIAFLVISILLDGRKSRGESAEDGEIICALTEEHCIFVAGRDTCIGCPIAEEAEKIGNR